MNSNAPGSFGAQLKALREAAGFTQEELATIAGLSVHAVSALERGQRRRPQVDTVRALSAALDLAGPTRDQLPSTARTPSRTPGMDELRSLSLPLAPTAFVGREDDLKVLRQWLTDRLARLITLTGPGGAGKTRLALELAREIAADGTARVVLVPLAAIRDTGLVAAAIAEALGLVDTPAAESAEAGEDRVGRQSDAARPRQLRAGPRGGAAHRGDPVVGRLSSRAGHEPRPAPPARRTGIRCGVPRPGRPGRRTVAWRSRALTGRAAVPRPSSRRRTRLPPDVRQRPDGHGDLPAARRPAARARAGGAVAEGALARRAALATGARCAALSCRAARSSGTAADDERDHRLELSAARCERTARVPATRRAARAFLHRPGRCRRVRCKRVGFKRRCAEGCRGADRQEPPRAGRNLRRVAAPVPHAGNGPGLRRARARHGGRTRRREGGPGALLPAGSSQRRRRTGGQ